ncbi:hypothetical protein HJC23_007795 [Cyclotella cryptica]|uniref:Uncharacterized protein n=1 Tax=Cyclotella cryptica TaxID=29204 RepID=A0ABD3QZZ1_9STRA|eukprot:CCRYP_000065-RA/>CCRYP_000065-RA protein AED:0.04 eAED:0.04 QI:0/-1/0/1/-1/1/1/0/610
MSDKPTNTSTSTSTNTNTSRGQEEASSHTSSPIPGINFELATLFIRAIQTKRKFLSKTSASTGSCTTDDGRLQSLRDNAHDATQAFMLQLRRQVQNQTVAASKRGASSNKRGGDNNHYQQPISNAATHCTQFLLETLSNDENSFHLRRASLSLLKEILERSSDARAHLSNGSLLMDYIAMIQRVNAVQQEEAPSSNVNGGFVVMSRNVFQHEALEIIQFLAERFGKFYPKFLVALRIMGEISIGAISSSSLSSSTANNGTRQNVKALRIERDEALKVGCKACQVMEGMVERAEEYFRILVPRFGGFMDQSRLGDADSVMKVQAVQQLDNVNRSESDAIDQGLNEVDPGNEVGGAIEDNDDDGDSIDWEEGDTNFSDPHDKDDKDNANSPNDNPSNLSLTAETTTPISAIDHAQHDTAVTETLAIMEKSGALHEGGLTVQLGSSAHNLLGSNANNQVVHEKLKKLVEHLSSRKLPRLHRWINALSHADGMEERSVADSASGLGGTIGPVSLVLLSEEKRALRGSLLKRMMKVRSEIEMALQSAHTLGALEEQEELSIVGNQHGAKGANNHEGTNLILKKKTWLSSFVVAGKKPAPKKKPRNSKFKVIYRKN